LDATFFKTPAEFRRWLERNHDKAKEVWVGSYKVASGKKSITWAEAVDVALCFGWIDSVGLPIDEMRRKQRFTPRRKGSKWSNRNVERVKLLKKEGLMHPAGLRAFEARIMADYSSQGPPKKLPAAYVKKLKANKKASAFFEAQPPSYRRVVTHWVVSAKKEETQLRRLNQLIQASAKGERLGQFYRPAKK
jgi:uncharacterized protein YdeI (YjbR/CyaY-like superfamily)